MVGRREEREKSGGEFSQEYASGDREQFLESGITGQTLEAIRSDSPLSQFIPEDLGPDYCAMGVYYSIRQTIGCGNRRVSDEKVEVSFEVSSLQIPTGFLVRKDFSYEREQSVLRTREPEMGTIRYILVPLDEAQISLIDLIIQHKRTDAGMR